MPIEVFSLLFLLGMVIVSTPDGSDLAVVQDQILGECFIAKDLRLMPQVFFIL